MAVRGEDPRPACPKSDGHASGGVSGPRAEQNISGAGTDHDRAAELQLIDAALQGDIGAFADLFERYRPALYALCLKQLGDPSLAEDIVQEVFIKAFRNLSKFDRSKSFWPWLSTMAFRMCIDLQRRRSFTHYSGDIASSVDADESNGTTAKEAGSALDAVIASEERAEVWESLEVLPKRQRRVFLLYAVDGWSCADIAAAEGISVGAVKLLLFRARRKMRAVRESGLPMLVALPFTWLRSRLQEAEERVRMALGALGERLSGAGALAASLGILAVVAITVGEPSEPLTDGGAVRRDEAVMSRTQSQTLLSAKQNQNVSSPNKVPVVSQQSSEESPISPVVDAINPNRSATPENSYISSLTVSPNYEEDKTVVALGRSKTTGSTAMALFVSQDGGATWKTRPSVLLRGHNVLLPPGYPSDPRIYAFGSELFQQSDDGGETFRTVSPSGGWGVAVSPLFGRGNSKILIGGYAIFEFDADTGVTLPVLSTIPSLTQGARYPSIAFSPGYSSDPVIIVSEQKQGGPAYLYRCNRWVCDGRQLPVAEPLSVTLSPHFEQDGLAYAFTPSHLFAFRDGGRTLQELQFPLPGFESITDMAILWDRSSAPAIFVSTLTYHPASGIYRSLDGGGSWNRIRIDLPGFGLGARELIVTPTGRLLAAAYGVVYGIACSDDGGQTWAPRCPPEQ